MKHTQTKLFIMFLAGILFSAITVFAATISVSTDFAQNTVQYLNKLVLHNSENETGVVIDGTNKQIGIGVENPRASLDINGSIIIGNEESEERGMIRYNEEKFEGFNGSQWIDFSNGADLNDYYTKDQSDGRYLQSYSETDPAFQSFDGSGITLTDIAYWDAKLDSESDPVFNTHSGDYYTKGQSDSKYLTSELWNTGTSNSINYTDGNVGIGVSNPDATLDVNGNIKMLSSVKAGGQNSLYASGSSRYFPSGVLTGADNDALTGDSIRYIMCNDSSTGRLLLYGMTGANMDFFIPGTVPTFNSYFYISGIGSITYHLKAGETFAVGNICPGGIMVLKQNYGQDTTTTTVVIGGNDAPPDTNPGDISGTS